MYTPGNRNRLSPVPGRLPFFPVIGWLSRMRLTHQWQHLLKSNRSYSFWRRYRGG
jgi:hypothetical protein